RAGVLFMVVFFFFQAEDGIRDKLVTGVQTCALPIYYLRELLRCTRRWSGWCSARCTYRPSARAVRCAAARAGNPGPPGARPSTRSEERRVGKECRSLRPAHQTSKTQPTVQRARATQD